MFEARSHAFARFIHELATENQRRTVMNKDMPNQNPLVGQVVHIVAFMPKATTTPEQMEEFVVTPFRQLPAQIPLVTSFVCGKNNSPEHLARGYEYFFVLTFKSVEDRDNYLTHPTHRAFGASIKPYVDIPDGVWVIDGVGRPPV